MNAVVISSSLEDEASSTRPVQCSLHRWAQDRRSLPKAQAKNVDALNWGEADVNSCGWAHGITRLRPELRYGGGEAWGAGEEQ
jgi:hypothetical protein